MIKFRDMIHGFGKVYEVIAKHRSDYIQTYVENVNMSYVECRDDHNYLDIPIRNNTFSVMVTIKEVSKWNINMTLLSVITNSP